MITKQQAIDLGNQWSNITLHHIRLTNADGTPARCRVNGKCRTWVTRPDDFRLPVKHGLRDCFYITPTNAHEWVDPQREEEVAAALAIARCINAFPAMANAPPAILADYADDHGRGDLAVAIRQHPHLVN